MGTVNGRWLDAQKPPRGPLLNLIANHEYEKYKFGWLRGLATIRTYPQFRSLLRYNPITKKRKL
jgi:hypothetical protein